MFAYLYLLNQNHYKPRWLQTIFVITVVRTFVATFVIIFAIIVIIIKYKFTIQTHLLYTITWEIYRKYAKNYNILYLNFLTNTIYVNYI